MADTPETYGGEGKRFEYNGKQLYTIVDAKTGEATFYEDKSFFGSIKLGTMKKGEDFVPFRDKTKIADYDSVFQGDDSKKFLNDANQKSLRQEIEKTVYDGNIEANVDPTTARLRTNQLLDPDNTTALTDPNQSEEDSAAQASQKGLDKVNQEAEELINSEAAKARTNTRKGPGSFGDHSYPLDRNQSQDFMKFTLLEYKPKKVGGGASGGGFGFADRARVGPNGTPPGRTILGSVSLPIPGGIKDENGCDWAGNTMDEVAIQAGALARGMLGTSGESGTDAADAIVGRLGDNSEVVQKAIKETFAGKAVGVKNLMTRSTGLIFNPNLELLFDKPVLRGFQFSFDLTPRSQKEAEEVVKIIKFFKQGMAAIRSESNLFLLSPHVFQVHYILNGDGQNDHPYIGKMKECAMTNFNVDYTPQANYSTLKDGFMTAYKISMQMKELEPIFNDEYGSGNEIEIGF